MNCLCFKEGSASFVSTATFKAKSKIRMSVKATIVAKAEISSNSTRISNFSTTISGEAVLSPKLSSYLKADATFIGKGEIRRGPSVDYSIKQKVAFESSITAILQKIKGNFRDDDCYDKLYPISDISSTNLTAIEIISGVDTDMGSSSLYDYIDEGVYTGNYHTNGRQGELISDPNYFIRTISPYSYSEYKCELSQPYVSFKDSHIVFNTVASENKQKIYDIEFKDPSGNLICKYEDLEFFGDNYSTILSSKPLINNGALSTWETDYPILVESGCTLGFKTISTYIPGRDGFSDGFGHGFELSSSLDSLTLGIVAVEVCNSGDDRYRNENFLSIFTEVQPTGTRLEMCLNPKMVLANDFETDVWPEVQSVWKNRDGNIFNTNEYGQKVLAGELSENYDFSNITLDSSSVADSGKLNLLFSHDRPEWTFGLKNGEFGLGFSHLEYDAAFYQREIGHDSWFTIDKVILKVRAKKAIGSRDYTLDVVGWSDDRLLNVTSSVGGFLQNLSGIGDLPTSSGWGNSDYESLAGESFSDQDEYFKTTGTNNPGSDHHQLYQNIVTSTSFQEYEVPLKIYEDNVEIGRSKQYNQSSFFESLYLDIYPLPSGASISHLELCVQYKPSNAFILNVLGGNVGRIDKDRKEGKFFPTQRQIGDDIVNAGSGYGPLSLIENIPHSYRTPNSLKTNYSRRWRGVNGIVSGPFDPNEFDFSFENPQLDSPFLLGYYDFNDYSGITLESRPLANLITKTGTASSSITPHKNIGFRFKNSSLVTTSNPYESIDWNSRTLDAYDNAFRTDTITFDHTDFSSGYAVYVRFSPDETITAGEKTIIGRAGDVSLRYEHTSKEVRTYFPGGTATTQINNPIFPLSAVITYNDNNSQMGKLYVLDEANSTIHKEEIGPYSISDPGTAFILDNASQMFIHELGLSSYNASGSNIIDGDIDTPDLLYRQHTAQSFLEGQSVHLWNSGESWENDTYLLPNYVDEDTCDWHMGEFKFLEFAAQEFDVMTKRVGRDAINFRLVCDGVPYFDKTDLSLPSEIDSGVSYHTQLENDFLRFNLSDTEPSFYSANLRISKDLPRGYHFGERAFVVESVVDYTQSGEIIWPDGKLGPKLIVSLYTKNQEPSDHPTENWGLINRKSHYLHPRMSWERLDSVFDPESYFDESEEWAKFPEERRLTEFNHKYYSKDVDDMFLQYDLVTPSGDNFDLNINLHSAHVRLEDALVVPSSVFDSLDVSISGVDFIAYEPLVLHTSRGAPDGSGSMLLHTSGNVPIPFSGSVNLCASGADIIAAPTLDLHTTNFEKESGILDLYTSGNYRVEAELNLLLFNDNETIPSDLFLTLQTYATAQDTAGLFNSCNLVSYSSLKPSTMGAKTETLDIKMVAGDKLSSVYSEDNFNLHTIGPNYFNENLNLVLYGKENPSLAIYNDTLLHSICYPIVYLNGSGSPIIDWNSSNVGYGVEEQDEHLFKIESIDLIRGVDTMCWGDCTQDSGRCIEEDVVTHETNWSNKECVEGGVLRPSTTYRNEDSVAFNDPGEGPYYGHFHGLRKYKGLYPNTAYDVRITAKAGSKIPVDAPREWEEWEYGSLGDIDYSGFKLVAPTDYITNIRTGEVVTNRFNEIVGWRHIDDDRDVDNLYGNHVKVKEDLMGVGAPFHNLGVYKDAGAIFLYRRKDTDHGGDKAHWDLENKITLPSGFITDWFYDRGGSISFPGLGTIPEKQWNIGQEGRELGSSFDIAVNDGREVIVAGGPGAKWTTRSFQDIVTSGVNVALVVFNNEFKYKVKDIDSIIKRLDTHNFLYKYFADPAVKINLKIISCVPTGIFDSDISIHPAVADYLTVKKIPRSIPSRPEDPAITAEMLSGIKEGFLEAFPYDPTKLNNNIPPIVGFYVDNSRSLGRDVVEPAVDQFVQFYKNYSYQSGVKDFYNVQSTGYIYEYIPTPDDRGEDWFDISNKLMDELLDTGRLVETGAHTLITSGVGLEHANEDAVDFNLPPDSGGRVYIFEKEDSDWNLVQEIKSPSSSISKLPARFGHSVAISEDASTISIGSPFIRESCMIYKFNKNELGRLYSNIGNWLKFRDDSVVTGGQYFDLYQRWKTLEGASGLQEAGIQIYSELSQANKFKARSDYDYWKNNHIKPYRLEFQYGLDDLEDGITGLFVRCPKSSANPRLGYSTAINEDGSIVAFGSPTDGLGPYDDADIYHKHDTDFEDFPYTDGLWESNLNAGAVRVFEKGVDIKPVTSNKVIEYNKFGNLSNTLNNTERFDSFGNETNSTVISKNSEYEKTQFSDISIPDEVSSIFIITPEIDAANDEVVEEIKRWMALGDRKLVLVGDDPLWEKNGAYAESNRIINKLLEKLDSRMRLHPAKTKREALLVNNTCASGEDVVQNITKSYIPAGSNNTDIKIENNLHGYGVADIRLHIPEVVMTADHWTRGNRVVDNKKYGKPSNFNPICGPPIAHEGDLRARWVERELKHPPDPSAKDPFLYWERNLPFEFFSNGVPKVKPTPPEEYALNIARDINILATGEQPRPLMVAAEFTENLATIPARPEIIQRNLITETTSWEVGTTLTHYEFDQVQIPEVAFIWSEDSGVYNFLDMNIMSNRSEGIFYNPGEINDRDALLQADGTLDIQVTTKELTTHFEVDDKCNIVATQDFFGSTVYLIATVNSESQESLSHENDENISFYDNVVRLPNCDNATIIQLGGWTGNDSFASAYDKSLLKNLFEFKGHNVKENWSGTVVPSAKDVAWIANTSNQPSEDELNSLIDWLKLGNKKLVITYSDNQSKAANTLSLCDRLGLDVKPWYLPGANKLPTYYDYWDRPFFKRYLLARDMVLEDTDLSIKSCNDLSPVTVFKFSDRFIPINLGNSGKSVIRYDHDVLDQKVEVTDHYRDVWRMNTGVTQIRFPASPGSGYRIHYNWVSDLPGEKQPISMYVGSAHVKEKPDTKAGNPDTVGGPAPWKFYDFDENSDLILAGYYSSRRNMIAPSFGPFVRSSYIDVQADAGLDYIDLFFTGNQSSVSVANNQVPRTCKLLSVSGCPLPINEVSRVVISVESETEVVGYEDVVVQEYIPPQTVVLPATIKPIMNDNTKYCLGATSWGGKLVADGPVVMAEEPEHFSNFVSGKERSKILLISDSTIVNGCLEGEGTDSDIDLDSQVSGVPTLTSADLLSRVNDLLSSIQVNQAGGGYVAPATDPRYKFSQKIVGPEKGSPGAYAAISGDGSLGVLFGLSNVDSISKFGDDLDYDVNNIIEHQWPDDTFLDASDRVLNQFVPPHMFKATIDGEDYSDAPMSGDPFSSFFEKTGKDFLQHKEFLASGYPGDLFGYDIDIHNDRIIVSSPYNAYIGDDIVKWSGIIDADDGKSKTEIGPQGGGGSVYVFEKDIVLGWAPTYKLKPSGVHATPNSDRFGWSVSTDADFCAIGAPFHDFKNEVIDIKGEFVRKEFDSQFDIGQRDVYDLGVSGLVGDYIENVGAVFTFENKMTDWANRVKTWQLAEKINAQGYEQDQENSSFGESVSISRMSRDDSDYVMGVGSPTQRFGVSGATPELVDAGAVYTYDAMLRGQPPSEPSQDSWIHANVFGQSRDIDEIYIAIDQAGNLPSETKVYASGLVFSNQRGEIFVEVSGQDPRDLGFIKQRPFIERIDGNLAYGTPVEELFRLFVEGSPFYTQPESMNLFIDGPISDIVYNNLELSTHCAYFADVPSGINMVTYAASPTIVDNSGLLLHTSGIGILSPTLDLRIRGK